MTASKNSGDIASGMNGENGLTIHSAATNTTLNSTASRPDRAASATTSKKSSPAGDFNSRNAPAAPSRVTNSHNDGG